MLMTPSHKYHVKLVHFTDLSKILAAAVLEHMPWETDSQCRHIFASVLQQLLAVNKYKQSTAVRE